jgi:methionyl-tRNA formyltransferase
MKIVLWIGNEPNQKALANKLQEFFPISAIVTETRHSKRKLTLRLIYEKIIEKIFLSSIEKAWWEMHKYYDKNYTEYPDTEILDVENINSEMTYIFTAKHNPDLILVSGTRHVKEKMFNISPSIGILNLHTGLSPYVKGGPNCTNWCIANKDFHLIGNTIMWIDNGIDTGNILTTEFTQFDGYENLLELHIKVMEHAHSLYINAVKFINSGNNQSIKQSEIANGKTYFNIQWTIKQKKKIIRNFGLLKKEIDNGNLSAKRKEIKTVKLKTNIKSRSTIKLP